MSNFSSSFCNDEELLEELNKLGYDEVSPDVFNMMKDDLAELIDKDNELSTDYNTSGIPEPSDLLTTYDDSPSDYHVAKEKSKKSEKSMSRKLKKKSNNHNSQTSNEYDWNNQSIDSSKGLSTERRKMKSTNVSLESVDSLHDDVLPDYPRSEGNYYTKESKDNNNYSNSRAFKSDINRNDRYECDSDMEKLSLRDNDYDLDYSSNRDRLLLDSDIPVNQHTDFYSENGKSYDEVYDLPSSSRTATNNSWKNVKYAFKSFKLQKNFSRVDDESAVFNYKGSDLNLNNTRSSSNYETKVMKRKVLRRRNGRSVITEELVELPSKFDTSYPESESLNSTKSFSSDDLSPKSNSSTGSVAAISPESSIKSSPSTLSLVSTRSTSLRVPNTRKKKNDPVAMYNYYRKFWDNFKPPGENKHDRLRWAVRDKMLDYNI